MRRGRGWRWAGLAAAAGYVLAIVVGAPTRGWSDHVQTVVMGLASGILLTLLAPPISPSPSLSSTSGWIIAAVPRVAAMTVAASLLLALGSVSALNNADFTLGIPHSGTHFVVALAVAGAAAIAGWLVASCASRRPPPPPSTTR